MNLETINKWLDEEYGCSYTRLEELHDFYFEKYCDLQQENKQLKDSWNKLREYITEANEDLYWTNNYDDILHVMQELEQGSDNNGQ